MSDVVFSDDGIRSAFELIRRYHDVTAGCALAGDQEVVCHGDLSPWNTVYDERGAVAFIDWDNARPGRRCEDVGYAVWRYLMLGFPAAPPLLVQRRQLRLVAETYGTWHPSELVHLVADAQRSQHQSFRSALAAGDERIERLVALGALSYIEGARVWLDAHSTDLLR
jgi:aminoglycoside phosphotransferase (APT) family kinase protein